MPPSPVSPSTACFFSQGHSQSSQLLQKLPAAPSSQPLLTNSLECSWERGEGRSSLKPLGPGEAVLEQWGGVAPLQVAHAPSQASCVVDIEDGSGWTALHHAGGCRPPTVAGGCWAGVGLAGSLHGEPRLPPVPYGAPAVGWAWGFLLASAPLEAQAVTQLNG